MRVAEIKAEQAPMMRELRQVHATQIRSYQLIDSFAATVSKGERTWLAHNPAVARVIPDAMIQLGSGPVRVRPLQGTGGACAARRIRRHR